MLLAALPLAAALALAQSDAGSTRPPAQVEAPESLRRERQARPEDDPAEHLGLAAPEVLPGGLDAAPEVGVVVEGATAGSPTVDHMPTRDRASSGGRTVSRMSLAASWEPTSIRFSA